MNKTLLKILIPAIMLVFLVGSVEVLPTEYHKDVPFHQQENSYYCRPASAQMVIDYFEDSYPPQTQIYDYARSYDPSGYPNSYQVGTSPFGLKQAIEHYTDLTGDVLQEMDYDTLRTKLYNNIIPIPVIKPPNTAATHHIVYTGWWKPWYWFDYAYYNDPDPDVGGKDKSVLESTFKDWWENGYCMPFWSFNTALLVSE